MIVDALMVFFLQRIYWFEIGTRLNRLVPFSFSAFRKRRLDTGQIQPFGGGLGQVKPRHQHD